MSFSEDDLLPISGLQHLAFCERQWGLIQIEEVWEENPLTVEGGQLHERVHECDSESRRDVRVARGLRVRSLRLGLAGRCDVVEFHRVGSDELEEKAGRVVLAEEAGKMPAPQEPIPYPPCGAQGAGKMPAPQGPASHQPCGAGFQPASACDMGFQPASACDMGFQPASACDMGFQPASQSTTPGEVLAATEPPLTLGSCILKRADCAGIVQDALLHFEGKRYHLVAWCVMPNHVHVLVAPLGAHTLSDILHSWKSFTASRINEVLGRKGAIWERESFDHIIRTVENLERFRMYVEENPVAAGLCKSPKDWAYGSCGAGFQSAETYVFVPAADTPYVSLKSRGELPHLHKDTGTYFVTFRLADAVVPGPDRTHARQQAGKMPAPQRRMHALQGGMAALQEAGKMPAPQGPVPYPPCGAGFQPASACAVGFQPASPSRVLAVPLPGARGLWSAFPVEYKRGKPKPDRCDEVQLCAQALCLEEMLGVSVPEGALFYGKTRRRHDVAIDADLRRETERLAARLHELYRAGMTPRVRYEKKCDRCSLYNVCLPKATGLAGRAADYLGRAIAANLEGEEAP